MGKRNFRACPVSDHGTEQVLWGSDCCHATVVPEQGAGAVEEGAGADVLPSCSWICCSQKPGAPNVREKVTF